MINECKCGCGQECKKDFVRGHNNKLRHVSTYRENNTKPRKIHPCTICDTPTKRKIYCSRPCMIIGFTGRPISDETKQKTREITIKQWEDGIHDGQSWGIGESYPERCYRERLEALGYRKDVDFFQEIRVGRYSLDFSFKDCMIDFEIDGSQHLRPKEIERDKIRDEYLVSQGWTVMRLSAKKLKQLMKKNVF